MGAMQVVIILSPLPTMKDYNNANGAFCGQNKLCHLSKNRIKKSDPHLKKSIFTHYIGKIDKIEMIKKQAFYRGTFDFSSINGSIKLKIIKK